VEITVIDDRGFAGWVNSATRVGEIYMTNVTSMVDNVLAEANDRAISRLNILDHGNRTRIQIGDDRITLGNLQQHEPELQRLRGHFTPGGFVHLHHCEIGLNQPLLLELARIWQVPVYAGTGDQNGLRFNSGEYVQCEVPNGCTENVRRPGTSGRTRTQPRYLGNGAHVGSDGIIRQGAGPKL
jgi:hypothetical protein